jgi:hypothetical protein
VGIHRDRRASLDQLDMVLSQPTVGAERLSEGCDFAISLNGGTVVFDVSGFPQLQEKKSK